MSYFAPITKVGIVSVFSFEVTSQSFKVASPVIPNSLGQSYIDTFGLLTVRTKEEVENWLLSHNV